MIGLLTRVGAQHSRNLVLVLVTLVCDADRTPAPSPIQSYTYSDLFAGCSVRIVIPVSFVLAAWRCQRPLLSETTVLSGRAGDRQSPTSFRRAPASAKYSVHVTRHTRTTLTSKPSSNVSMGRTVDQDVHAAFVEFRAKGNHVHQHLHRRAAASTSSPMLICVQKTTSASRCNASTASKSGQRTLHARSSIFSSAPASQTILMPHVPKQALETEAQPLQMASTGHQP